MTAVTSSMAWSGRYTLTDRIGIAALAALLLAAAAPAGAQSIRRSQEAAVRQRIGDTWIELRYQRPVARGRSPIFGNLVAWHEDWTPGADSATTLSVSTPITVEGQALPRGTYSIWMIADSSGPWTVIFSKTARAWHRTYPGEANDQLRVRVTPTQTSHMETLAWYFPVVDGAQATLVMHWGSTSVPLEIRVNQTP